MKSVTKQSKTLINTKHQDMDKGRNQNQLRKLRKTSDCTHRLNQWSPRTLTSWFTNQTLDQPRSEEHSPVEPAIWRMYSPVNVRWLGFGLLKQYTHRLNRREDAGQYQLRRSISARSPNLSRSFCVNKRYTHRLIHRGHADESTTRRSMRVGHRSSLVEWGTRTG